VICLEFDRTALRRRLKWALLAYALFGILAALTLEGALLYAVLLFLGALALRSWAVVKREELD